METVSGRGSTAVVYLDDEYVGCGLDDLRDRVRELVRGGRVRLIVDVSAVSRPTSTLVTGLLQARQACALTGGRVVLRGANRRCLEVLSRADLWRMFDVQPAGGVHGSVAREAEVGR